MIENFSFLVCCGKFKKRKNKNLSKNCHLKFESFFKKCVFPKILIISFQAWTIISQQSLCPIDKSTKKKKLHFIIISAKIFTNHWDLNYVSFFARIIIRMIEQLKLFNIKFEFKCFFFDFSQILNDTCKFFRAYLTFLIFVF